MNFRPWTGLLEVVGVDGKYMVIAVVLAMICGGVVLWSTGILDGGGPQPPDWVLDQETERVDRETGDLITMQMRKWRKLGYNDRGFFKNPNTGKFTMVYPMTCASCGEKIPPPDMPEYNEDDMEAMMAADEEYEKALREFVCPKCNNKAFDDEFPPYMAEPPMNIDERSGRGEQKNRHHERHEERPVMVQQPQMD